MIEISSPAVSLENKEEFEQSIGFQFLVIRHQKQMSLKKVSQKSGFKMSEIDDFERGKVDLALYLCLCYVYHQIPEENEAPWKLVLEAPKLPYPLTK